MKSIYRFFIFVGILIAVVCAIPSTVKADDTTKILVNGTYGQTEARSMLAMINAFRKNEGTQEGNQAWWLNPDGGSDRIAVNGLNDLIYDYRLEKIAMQRAAELAVQYSHQRPNGTQQTGTNGVNAENIASGHRTAQSVFNAWLEADAKDFSGQGHRSNMLGGYYVFSDGEVYQNFLTTIGIGHFIYNGRHFWVQVFGTRAMDTTATDTNDSEVEVPVTILSDKISDYKIEVEDDISLQYHTYFDLSECNITTSAIINQASFPVESEYTWDNLNSSLASLNENVLYGKALGDDSLQVSNTQGKTEIVPYKILPCDISDASFLSEVSESEISVGLTDDSEFGFKAMINDETLVCGEDYTVEASYDDGTEVDHAGGKWTFPKAGNVTFTIHGTGNYTGTASQILDINVVPASLNIYQNGENQLELEYGTSSDEIEIFSDFQMFPLEKYDVVIADDSIVSAESISDNNTDDIIDDNTGASSGSVNSYKFRLNPLKAGETDVTVSVPEKSGVYHESNKLVIHVTVHPKKIDKVAVLSGIKEVYVRTGEPITPIPTVIAGTEELNLEKDFKLSYEIDDAETDTPVGSEDTDTTVLIKATANGERYTGTVTKSFVIHPLRFEVELDKEYTYRRSGVKPEPRITCDGNELHPGTDYSLTYGDNNTVGENVGSITIIGKNDYQYAQEKTLQFNIVKANIFDADVTSDLSDSETEVGKISADKIIREVIINGEDLQNNKDYIVSAEFSNGTDKEPVTFKNNEWILDKAGTVSFSVSGIGNYEGTCQKIISLKVIPFHLSITSDAEESLALECGDFSSDITITPNYQMNRTNAPVIEVDDNDIIQADITEEKDSDNPEGNDYFYKLKIKALKAGKSSIKLQIPGEAGVYTDSNTLTINVVVTKKIFESHAAAVLQEPDMVYKYTAPDHPHKPAIDVTLDGTETLTDGRDYNVEYTNNIFAGTASIKVTPAGMLADQYDGEINLQFEILRQDTKLELSDSNVEVEFGEEKTVTFKGAKSSVTQLISSGSECVTAELKTFNTEDGTGEITIKGLAQGEANLQFTQAADNRYIETDGSIHVSVKETTLSEEEVEAEFESGPYNYTNEEIKPAIVNVRARGIDLKEDQYTVSYEDNIQPGKATITISGTNGLTFTKTVEFEIVQPVVPEQPEPGKNDHTDSTATNVSGTSGNMSGSAYAPGTNPAQMGEGGSPIGKGASLAAAENAIMTASSDEGPAGSTFAPLMLKSSKQSKKSVTVTWKKPAGAVSYAVYGNKCGKANKMSRLGTTTSAKFTLKKLNNKSLKKGTYYKLMVIALDANQNVVSASKVVHAATSGGKAGNPKKLTTKAKGSKVTIKKGKTYKLAAKQTGKSVKKHRVIKYESSNPAIATVSKKGVIKGRSKGSCKIYVYAQNGLAKVIKVKIK